MTNEIPAVQLAIIGSGFGGLGAAVMALEHGIETFVVLERSTAVGGTWRDNTYPGCACDIPSHLYSFSFAQNPEWTRSYPSQPEIEQYLEHVADQYNLHSRIRFGFNVELLAWDEKDRCWAITSTSGETIRAAAVISASGFLSQPSTPDIPGLSDFEGEVFHSASWRHDVSLESRRVGVIGTGASAIQIVPAIVDSVDHLDVFQRTAPWVLPRDDHPAPAWRRRLYRMIPFLQRLHRWRIYLHQEIRAIAFLGTGRVATVVRSAIEKETKALISESFDDPDAAASLLPSYQPGCKRLLLSSDWYPALARETVSLVSSSIVEVTAAGVRTSDEVTHPLDVLILATGFEVSEFPSPLTILGTHGRSLNEHWSDGASTDFGMTVSGFPNLWFLVGPGTGLGHNSIVFMIEVQLQQIARALRYMRESGVSSVELRPEVEAASYSEIQRRIATTVWASGCSSWYQSNSGRIDTLWPGTTTEYWWRARRFDPDRYVSTIGRFGEMTPSR